MTRPIRLQESADPDESSPIHEQFTPLCERAVRSDGTIGIKIISPGWGTSGYYGRPLLERDIPRVFPAGTQMFWNHDTAMEEAERPEGDLSRLAAVTVSAPVWLDNGAKGPGMYADVRPFAGYAETIDEIGEHIGVSIRALGRHSLGEAEGKRGKIINELVVGKSVDFVTVPGAGGAILSVFEAAPHAAPLPLPTNQAVDAFLREAGRVLSAANEQKLRAALAELTAVLSILDNPAVAETTTESTARPDAATNPTEDDMELQEALDALAAAQIELEARNAALAKMQEQLLLREARDYVTGKLAEAGLPDMTQARLTRELASNPPVTEGRIDEAALSARLETAVNEAKAEIAAIAGKDGRVTGNGETTPANGETKLPTLAESRARTEKALAGLGYMKEA